MFPHLYISMLRTVEYIYVIITRIKIKKNRKSNSKIKLKTVVDLI